MQLSTPTLRMSLTDTRVDVSCRRLNHRQGGARRARIHVAELHRRTVNEVELEKLSIKTIHAGPTDTYRNV
jgi:hypothetical protein